MTISTASTPASSTVTELPVPLHQVRHTFGYDHTNNVELLEQDEAETAIAYWYSEDFGDGLRRYQLLSRRQFEELARKSLFTGKTMLEVLAEFRLDGSFALVDKNYRITQKGRTEPLND